MLIGIHTLGCKVNQFESQCIAENLTDLGYTVYENILNAHLFVVNTCTVTARSSYQSRQIIRKILKNCKNPKIIVTGCYAQNNPEEIQDISKEIVIIDNYYKEDIPEYIFNNNLSCKVGDIDKKNTIKNYLIKRPYNRTRAYLKIQDGCNSFCSYCIVPYTRGRIRSVKPQHIIHQLNEYKKNNIKEIILSGINLGKYGKDNNYNLVNLLDLILHEFSTIRFRLSSIEVTDITPELISLYLSHKNLCPHFHIPLQSGSDKILNLMNRRYNSSYFQRIINEIKTYLPNASIGCDVMVGFPYENNDDFMDTYRLIERLPLSYLHVFPFSKRKGTEAYNFGDDITKNEKEHRTKALLNLSNYKKTIFYNENLNQKLKCLVENKDKKTGLFRGFTENYIPLNIKSEKDNIFENEVFDVKISQIKNNHVIAELIK